MGKVKRPIKAFTNKEIDNLSSTDWNWSNDSEHSLDIVDKEVDEGSYLSSSVDSDKMWLPTTSEEMEINRQEIDPHYTPGDY